MFQRLKLGYPLNAGRFLGHGRSGAPKSKVPTVAKDIDQRNISARLQHPTLSGQIQPQTRHVEGDLSQSSIPSAIRF